MKKIAIISDIHGNSVALSAVLSQIQQQDIREVVILGDFIGYYHSPADVMRLLFDSGLRLIAVQGNHEKMLMKALMGSLSWEKIQEKYGHGLWLANEQMEPKYKEWLLNLPEIKVTSFGQRTVTITHGLPLVAQGYVYPDSSLNDLELEGIDGEVIMLGHTHYPMVAYVHNKLLINPGSVGQSRRYGGVAEWAVYYAENNTVVPQSTYYDVDRVINKCQQYDENLPYLFNVLRRGGR